MADNAPNGPATAVAERKPERIVSHDTGPNAHLFDTARFEQSQRIALAMARASLLPKHLVGKTIEETCANCLRIVNQAVRWGMDPFAIMDETYVVSGKLGYQGKLVAAVVNARAGLVGRLNYAFSGTPGKDDFTVTVSGAFADDGEVRTVTLNVAQAKTTNDIWRKNPEQKLCYSGATMWARRWCPEVLLGVITDDDIDHAVQAELRQAPATIADVTRQLTEAPMVRGDAILAAPPDETASMNDWAGGAQARGEAL